MAANDEKRRATGGSSQRTRLSYSDVLGALVTSSPAWIRGMTLLLLGGGVMIVVITVCAAIFAGREVSMWPPHVQAYVPPQVQNCNALLSALPDIRKAEEEEIHRVGSDLSRFLEQIRSLAKDYTVTGANTVYISSSMNDLRRDIEPLSKRLDDTLAKLRKRNDDVVAGCLNLGAVAATK
jgi:type IV secretory pathway TrbF-like protein